MEKSVQPRLSDVEQTLPDSFPYWLEFIKDSSSNYTEVKEIIKIKMDN